MNLRANPRNSRGLLILLYGFLLSSSGCLPNAAYRTRLPPCTSGPGPIPADCSVQNVRAFTIPQLPGQPDPPQTEVPLAFVEFDDLGQAFQPGQLQAAVGTIRDEKSRYGDVVTILFIHGWKNNASDKSGNVAGFRRFLQQLRPSVHDVGLVGVYFGWRGGTTNASVVKEFTYWNRRDTATYIPGSNLSEALLRISTATKGLDYGDTSPMIIIGHSFGGLVLERTVTQYLTRRVVENPSYNFRPFADLLVFVNEAAAATEAIQLLTLFHDHLQPQEYPTIVSITSQGDLATRFVLPVGQGASLFKKSLRSYGPPYAEDPFGIKNQRSYYLRSATHIPQLLSHDVGGDALRAAYLERGYTCASIPSAGGKNTSYYVVPKMDAKNTTPYWIMQMPVQIVPDHSNIFRLEFAALLQAFVLRQSQEDPNQRPDPDTCYSDINKAPAIDMRQMHSVIRLK